MLWGSQRCRWLFLLVTVDWRCDYYLQCLGLGMCHHQPFRDCHIWCFSCLGQCTGAVTTTSAGSNSAGGIRYLSGTSRDGAGVCSVFEAAKGPGGSSSLCRWIRALTMMCTCSHLTGGIMGPSVTSNAGARGCLSSRASKGQGVYSGS